MGWAVWQVRRCGVIRDDANEPEPYERYSLSFEPSDIEDVAFWLRQV